jgi:hypothetical protein
MPWSERDRQGVHILIGVGVVAATILGAFFYVSASRVPLDSANCRLLPGSRVNEPVPHTVLLIDQSEAFTANQRDIVLRRISGQLLEALKVGDRVSVFVFNKSRYFDLVPIFSQCVPPKDVNPLVGNRSKVKFFLEAQFVEPLKRAIAVGFTEVGDESPIIEAIQSVSRSGHVDRRTSTSLRLIVISDLLQHRSGKYSHYGRRADYAAFKASDYGAAVMPNLNGWDVDVYYVARFGNGKAEQTADHLKFWQQLIYDAGAKIASWEPVS